MNKAKGVVLPGKSLSQAVEGNSWGAHWPYTGHPLASLRVPAGQQGGSQLDSQLALSNLGYDFLQKPLSVQAGSQGCHDAGPPERPGWALSGHGNSTAGHRILCRENCR